MGAEKGKVVSFTDAYGAAAVLLVPSFDIGLGIISAMRLPDSIRAVDGLIR